MKILRVMIVLLLFPIRALAGICDTAWDGDKLIESVRGSLLTRTIRLRDKDTLSAEVTVGQVRAFYDAKERISKIVGLSPSFIICNSGDINAFATPAISGQIVGITVGMLKFTDGNPDMAAIVIGHEFAHHLKGHGAATQAREAITGLLGIILGMALEKRTQQRFRVTGLGIDLGQIGLTLVSRKFSRDQEREADNFGFEYLVSAGFNPIGAIQLATRMNQIGLGGIGWFYDSHPGWSEREANFRQLIAASPDAQRLVASNLFGTTTKSREPTQSENPIALTTTYRTTDAQKSYEAGVVAYRNGNIVNALREFRSAAEAGHASAQVVVGFLYENGRGGVPKDEVEAVRLYRLSADQGEPTGQTNLGAMFESGRGGLAKNEIEALRLYRLAADQGSAQAMANLGGIYANGLAGLAKDDVEAMRLNRLSADQGNASGQLNLGIMYANGRGGLAKNEVEAVRLYRLSVDQGNAYAQVYLGYMHANGLGGLSKDEAEAVKLFRLSAEQGNAYGQVLLGGMYENGLGGLTRNIETAIYWYRLSARQGMPLAKDFLTRLGKQ